MIGGIQIQALSLAELWGTSKYLLLLSLRLQKNKSRMRVSEGRKREEKTDENFETCRVLSKHFILTVLFICFLFSWR